MASDQPKKCDFLSSFLQLWVEFVPFKLCRNRSADMLAPTTTAPLREMVRAFISGIIRRAAIAIGRF